MKKTLRKISLFSICVLIITVISLSANNVKGYQNDTPIYVDIWIIEATYGDFDSDTLEDDIQITLLVETNFIGTIYNIMNLEIILPSGNGWLFEFRFSYYSNGEPVNIILTAYDTATESGWYLANVYGYMFLGEEYIAIYSGSVYFDPPTEGEGPSNPTGGVKITSA